MTGKKSRPYERACSRIFFFAASSSSGKGASVCEAIEGFYLPHDYIHRADAADRSITTRAPPLTPFLLSSAYKQARAFDLNLDAIFRVVGRATQRLKTLACHGGCREDTRSSVTPAGAQWISKRAK